MLLSSLPLISQQRYETGDINFEFKGTESFSDNALQDILILPKELYFNRINLADDLQRLNKFYFDNGFFDVLIDTSTVIVKDDKEVNVKFTIIENTRYTIRDVDIEGIDKVTDAVKNDIRQNSLLVQGNPYIRTIVIQERDRIYNALQNNGYYFAQIDTGRSAADSSKVGIIIAKYSTELQKNPDYKDKVLIKMRFIGTEDIYRFGKTKINFLDNKYQIGKDVIQRELKFKEGDIFDRSKMLESERNFTKLSIIQLGRVLPDTNIDMANKTVDINVNISFSNKYEITPGIAAVYQGNKFFGGVSLEYKDKDFFGGGRVFTITPELLYNSKESNIASVELSLFQPFLFNSNITATLSSTFAFINFNEILEILASINLLRLTYFIADYTFYNNAYSDLTFDYARIKAKQDFIDTEDSTLVLAGTQEYGVNSILGLTLIHNNTNNLFNPSSGFYHSFTVESAGLLPRLLSNFNKSLQYSQYVKLYTPNSFYYDISGDRGTSILATHFETGDIIEYGKGDNVVPVSELYKFFSGGGNSLRGWRAQENGILDDPKQGGKFLLEGSFEWRRKPFPQRSFLHPVWGVFFVDWGNVWSESKKFRFDQIALATGFGIRYDTFVGPVRIDVGFKLFNPSAKEGDRWLWENPKEIFKSKYAIQFGLGNAF